MGQSGSEWSGSITDDKRREPFSMFRSALCTTHMAVPKYLFPETPTFHTNGVGICPVVWVPGGSTETAHSRGEFSVPIGDREVNNRLTGWAFIHPVN